MLHLIASTPISNYFSPFRDSIAWPEQWNLVRDKHGHIVFPNPSTDALLIYKENGRKSYQSSVTASAVLQGGKVFEHSFNVETPRTCGLDVREDTRCDDTRSLLFGNSTSVGQICSVAEAVKNDPDTGEVNPDNMPGFCCLDNVKTLQNFGERVSEKNQLFSILSFVERKFCFANANFVFRIQLFK